MKQIEAFISCCLLALTILLSGCVKPKTGTFVLNISPKYGNQNLGIGSLNSTPNPGSIKVEQLQFFLAHIGLIKTDNTILKLSEVEFFDAGNGAVTLVFNNLNADFKGLTFGSGLDSILDTISPFGSNSPAALSYNVSGTMDGPQQGIVTSINFSGQWDSANTANLRNGFFYHIVGAQYYRQKILTNSFSVCCDNIVTKSLAIDIERIFYNGNIPTIDLSTQNTATNDSAVAAVVVNNFSNAFSLK